MPDFGGLMNQAQGMLNKETTTTGAPGTAAPAQTEGVAAPTGGAAPGATTGTAAPAGSQDYGDKAFAFAAKKSGHNVDASTSEKITDGARGLFEKATGKKVDSKYSN